MAKCDEGYLCRVCHNAVDSIVDSDLYLRYVLGRIDPETLHLTPELHLRCNPVIAQFIDDPRFEPVTVDSPMGLAALDPSFVLGQRELISRAYRRLWEIRENPGMSMLDYPLKEFRKT